jgi:riboflavin-specific deaminase-like protein
MGVPQPDPRPAAAQSPPLQRLLPPGADASVQEIVDDLGLWHEPEPSPGRPHVIINMVATVDGRASLDGRSAPLSSSADRALFHGLRTPVDAVLVGASTVRVERYGLIVRDEASRQARLARGLPAQPLACIVSGRLALGADIPLLADPEARVVIVTASDQSLPAGGARLDYVRARRDGLLDLPAALAQLRERFDVRTLLCEGGPHLASQLFAAGLVDELFLSVSPKLAGGPGDDVQASHILEGAELRPSVDLKLLGALHSDSHLFLRYGVAR